MKNVVAEISIENGGGNVQPIYDIIFELFDMGGTAKSRGFDSTLTYAQKFWDELCKIDCEKFYLPSGAKVTRPLKALLEEQFGKEAVKLAFAEFCKRVGNIYIEVKAQATLRNHYFTIDEGGQWNDDGSCFLDGGCNMHCGEWIDASPGIGVITIKPENKTYSRGRIIVWFKSPTVAHMVNVYSGRGGERELPRSIFVKALEVMSGAKISWSQKDEETLVIYLNRNPMILECTEGNFDSICQEYMFKCTECNKKYAYENNHTWSEDAYYNACSQHCIDNLTEDKDHCECTGCRYRMRVNNAFHAPNGDYLCESCYNERYFYCECCREDCDAEDAVEVMNGRHMMTVCSECAENRYTQCSECKRYYENNEMTEATSGEQYCPKCVSNCTKECDECEQIYDGSALDNFKDGLCEHCSVEEEEEVA